MNLKSDELLVSGHSRTSNTVPRMVMKTGVPRRDLLDTCR